MLLERVRGTILGYNMVRRGQRAGVAVSGGADSVFLLHALARLAPEMGLDLTVLHLNHGLRGSESDADEQFVLQLAANLGIPAHSGSVRLQGSPGNLEQTARRARLTFFAEARSTLGLDVIATGHTLSDQAETVLFRAVRGAGETGLRGILPVTREGIVRPLIEIRRGEVRAWLEAEGLPWREDSTNRDTRLSRNLIRAEVLPLLARLNPEVESALGRLASAAAEDELHWREISERSLDQAIREVRDGALILNAGALAQLPPALGKRVIRVALNRVCGSLQRFTSSHVEGVWRLATGNRGAGRVRVPRATVWRSLSLLRLARADRAAGALPGLLLASPGRITVPELSLEIVEETDISDSSRAAELSRYNEGSPLLDAERVPFPLMVRGWQPGDRYQPAGRAAESKVKEMLSEAGVPSWDRPLWPIVLSEGRIVWCRRFGCAAWAAAGAGCGRAWRVREPLQ